MTSTDLKIYILNAATLSITLTAIEPLLKVTLLIVSIGYTVHKWWNIYINKIEKEQ